jgi:hypothetical protein
MALSLGVKPLFEMTPEMYASIMVKSMEGNVPQTFKRDGLSLVVTKVRNEKSTIFINATTTHYKGIMEELKKHRSLPEDVQKQCKEFAKLSFVNQGVKYILHVRAKMKNLWSWCTIKKPVMLDLTRIKKSLSVGITAMGWTKTVIPEKA